VAVEFNHTIAGSRDRRASAVWLAALLGLAEPTTYGPFSVLALANGVSLDYVEHDGPIPSAHYCFLLSEDEFDGVLGRLREQERPYWADPSHREAGRWNTDDGGRGLYFEDLNGHNMEIITRPYGSG
jgi:hypothetical protein